MREIVVNAAAAASANLRVLVSGLASSGKTSFAASWPRPLFISDAAEGGYKTIFGMDPALWWDANVPPKVWAIESMVDVPQALSKLEQLAVQANGRPEAFPFGTIVFDPLSIYTDRVVSELQRKEVGRDNRQIYGDLANHLRSIIMRFHALPAHVVWLTHVQLGGNDANGPAIGGSMGTKMPAFCDFKWMTWAQTVPGQATQYELRTQPFRTWNYLGGRGVTLPDPMIPSFKCVAQILGLPAAPSPAVPGYPEGVDYRSWWQQQQPQKTSAAQPSPQKR